VEEAEKLTTELQKLTTLEVLSDKKSDEKSDPTPPKSPRPGQKPRPRGKGRGRGAMVEWFNKHEVLDMMAEIFHSESFGGWLLIGYQEDNATLELQACGDGGVTEFIGFLDDAQQQYVMMRIADETKSGPGLTSRDVLVTWQGLKTREENNLSLFIFSYQ